MTHLPLTPEQAELVAREWITSQCQHDYKNVLKMVFDCARSGSWAWDDALVFCVRYCSNQYAVSTKTILGWLTKAFTPKTKPKKTP